MTIQASSDDLSALAALLSESLGFTVLLSVSRGTLTVDAKPKGVRATIDFGVSVSNGALVLDIGHISAAGVGLGAFGIARRTIGNLMIERSAPFSRWFAIQRNALGNLDFRLVGLRFESIMAGDELVIQLSA